MIGTNIHIYQPKKMERKTIILHHNVFRQGDGGLHCRLPREHPVCSICQVLNKQTNGADTIM